MEPTTQHRSQTASTDLRVLAVLFRMKESKEILQGTKGLCDNYAFILITRIIKSEC
jgi:hypothetical protein